MQLAEGWILKSCKILEHPYSRHAYDSAIEEAEQFRWAGSEMDLVKIYSFVCFCQIFRYVSDGGLIFYFVGSRNNK